MAMAHIPITLPHDFAAAMFAIAITIYFWRQNILGIDESSGKAMRIMQVTTVMAVMMIVWCGNHPLHARRPPAAVHTEIHEAVARMAGHWPPARTIGAVGIMIAFGHSILAMSGEESLAQVNREIEAPKLKNLLRAGFVIFIYSMLLTSLISFFAVMIIPDDVRMAQYGDNLIGGLAMFVVGPLWLRLGAARLRGLRRLPDPGGRGQHRDRGFERRAQPRGRGRRAARLVPPSASALRHLLPDCEPGGRASRSPPSCFAR